MLKRYKNIIYILTFIFVLLSLCTNVIFASYIGVEKSGHGEYLSNRSEVCKSDEKVTIIRQKVDRIAPNNVVFVDQLNRANVFDTVTFGSYEQDNNFDNGYEPIEWIVLCKTEEGKALLTSKYILDCRKFNTYPCDITWERSTLRSWLNNNFYS